MKHLNGLTAPNGYLYIMYPAILRFPFFCLIFRKNNELSFMDHLDEKPLVDGCTLHDYNCLLFAE